MDRLTMQQIPRLQEFIELVDSLFSIIIRRDHLLFMMES